MKKPKFFLIPPLILALCLTLCVALATATETPEIVASGECGADGASVAWTLDSEGTLTISGAGDMADYNAETIPWKDVKAQIKSAVIANGVTNIGNATLYGCSGLTSVTIPNSVTAIGRNAFYGCSGLTSVTIPDSVTNIDLYAFYACIGLNNITIPKSVSSIESQAFCNCSGLTSVTILEGVTRIGYSVFNGCSSLTSVTIPESVTVIPYAMFEGCSSLASVTIPESVSSIEQYAFSGCSALSSVTIPERLSYIGKSAFSGCSGLTTVTIPQNTAHFYGIGDYAFDSCSSLTSIAIPKSVTQIGDGAFSNCINLISLQVDSENGHFSSEDGVLFNKYHTTLQCYPAGKADSLYQIPESVITIKNHAFCGCKLLTGVSIPVSVTKIEGYAFASCGRLKNVYYAGSETQWEEIIVAGRNEGITIWANIYYDGNRETPGRDTSKIPKIALTYAPAYGDGHNFQGIVYTEDGSEFDMSAYRVTLYVQREYPKPTWANPSVPINNGSFSLSYTSGGDTTRTFLDLMLIPADFDQKNASYEQTRSAAIDYVEVYRTKEGEVTILPERQPPESNNIAPAIPSGLLPVKQDKIVVDVGFYTNGSSPGSALSADLIRQQLDAVSKFSDTVRFYGSAGELAKAYEIAHNMGFAVLGNAWLSKDKVANQTELDALIEHCNNGYCKVAIVGSEVLLRGDLTAGELIEAIEYVRERLTDKTIPVTTADSVDILIATPSVRNACNLLMPNCYPYWGGSSIEQAAGHFIENMEALDAVRGEKEILVSETGWPTAGQGKDNAKAGETEAAQYYSAIREWSLSSNTQVLFFDATDEPWKTKDEGESGAHWGFMTTDFVLKDCYKNLNPFQEKYAIEYVSGNATSATASLTNNTGAVAEICYAVAAYNTNGRMISCNMVSKSMGVSESVSLAVSYSESDAVTQIKAFVLDANTFAPLQGAWAKNSE